MVIRMQVKSLGTIINALEGFALSETVNSSNKPLSTSLNEVIPTKVLLTK